MAEFQGGDTDQEIRQCNARPGRLRLPVDLPGAQGDWHGNGMDRHPGQQIVEKLLAASGALQPGSQENRMRSAGTPPKPLEWNGGRTGDASGRRGSPRGFPARSESGAPGGVDGYRFVTMLTFDQFLTDAANRGEAVNTLFEERLFGLVGILHKITDALAAEHIAHEVVGGLAVLIHVEEANPELTSLTRDVDLRVCRSDLERIKVAAAEHGFRFRHAAGVDMLIYGGAESARNAIHLIFSGEKVRPAYLVPTPAIRPERKQIHGKEVMVIPVADLVRMKLTSFRDKDRVHIRSLDAAGLLTSEIEPRLAPELAARLQHIRETE